MKKLYYVLCLMLILCLLVSTSACNKALSKEDPEIKNVILMISDGTSVGVSTLTRWYDAYNRDDGSFDTDMRLNVDEYVSGLIRTYWRDGDSSVGAITDSAPGATAYATGYKSQDKFLGMDFESKSRATLLELAESLGKSTGLVATNFIQHATPAAFVTHTTNREDYEDIASQMLEVDVDVLLGGGSQYMQNRADARDLIAELQEKDYGYVTTAYELKDFKGSKLYGLFAPHFMAYDIDRPLLAPNEPTLTEMTDKAIDLLSKNDKGFFLMVEGSKVDWGAHNNDPASVVSEFRAFDKAVNSAMTFAKGRTDTIVIVLEDHGTGGISLGSVTSDKNYPEFLLKDIIDPLTKTSITADGAIKLLAQGKSAKDVLALRGINDPTEEELAWTEALEPDVDLSISPSRLRLGQMLSLRSNIGWTTIGHTGEDVLLYSYLPGDKRITGLLDNTEITKIICDAWGAELTDSICQHKK